MISVCNAHTVHYQQVDIYNLHSKMGFSWKYSMLEFDISHLVLRVDSPFHNLISTLAIDCLCKSIVGVGTA